MDFSLTEEQVMLKDSVAKFLADNYAPEQREALVKQDAGYSEAHWNSFSELGWLTIPFSEELGGFGGNIADVTAVMEEFGKVLVVEPYWSSIILTGQLLARSSNQELKSRLMPEVISGQSQLSFAWLEDQAGFSLSHVATTATKHGEGYNLTGAKRLVLNAAADQFIIAARVSGDINSESGLCLFIVDAKNPAINIERVRLMDGQYACNITFTDLFVAQHDMLTTEGDAYPLIAEVVDEALVALCAEAVGAMTYLYKATTEYANTRKQFGVAIGSFQALQHRMVDMFMATEQCRSLLIRAQCAILDGSDERSQDIAVLKAMVGKYGRKVAEEAVQLHGGMGVTNEMPIGHYLKRLMMIDMYFGGSDIHRRRFCDMRYK
ncbi:Flavoprotein desaturase PigA [Zhongshania aliphaticivorans]|uniref:Flavoprotein desaturase PigA n=1 Tax=Zhongshania aliphaticivorans TaxID=1470434 RepID=A0A5S9ND68_9GAMM|nr:acyl-CoA dehydrogenase family protein [Zhongshania aliphaticivorans]CAA0079024.1 Flavoprotein desaturase PigA [Zhongshania aliphaticivorans]CAA0086320.1 Flavoprotein desaturase PigA [Zhongshania aliphaticivorans]